jgi:hypothetical protein
VLRQFELHDLGYYGSLIWDEAPRRQGGNESLIPMLPRLFGPMDRALMLKLHYRFLL